MPNIMLSEEFALLGMKVRESDNLLVGSFAAEIAGESYPFSKEMSEIVFRGLSDEQLGKKFVEWCDKNDETD